MELDKFAFKYGSIGNENLMVIGLESCSAVWVHGFQGTLFLPDVYF
jgi:hypothetical protein